MEKRQYITAILNGNWSLKDVTNKKNYKNKLFMKPFFDVFEFSSFSNKEYNHYEMLMAYFYKGRKLKENKII